MNHDKEQEFLNRVQKTLDNSVDEIDAGTRARLKAIRLNALESGQQKPAWYNPQVITDVFNQNRLVLATSMSVLILAGVWFVQKPTLKDFPVDDMQILTANDDLELYQELEFYQWLVYQSDQS